MPTVAEILSYAPGASFLSSNYNDKKTMYGGTKHNKIPAQIYAIYYVAKKIYDNDPLYPGLIPVTNYLWEIMGRWGIEAGKLTGGGGSVTPISPSLIPDIIDVFITSSSSPIKTGDSVINLSALGWIGFNMQVVRNAVVQSTNPTGGTYFAYDKTTAILTLYGAAQAGETIQLFPVY